MRNLLISFLLIIMLPAYSFADWKITLYTGNKSKIWYSTGEPAIKGYGSYVSFVSVRSGMGVKVGIQGLIMEEIKSIKEEMDKANDPEYFGF